jgi:hypothetical protein
MKELRISITAEPLLHILEAWDTKFHEMGRILGTDARLAIGGITQHLAMAYLDTGDMAAMPELLRLIRDRERGWLLG